MDYLMQNKEMPLTSSTLENIDTAVYKFVDENLNIYTTTNKGKEKVKVLWLGTERAYQTKDNKNLRDSVGKLILPLITVSRTSMQRDDTFKGSYQATYSPDSFGGEDYVPVKTVIKQDKTQNYANADFDKQSDSTGKPKGKKVVYETTYVKKPVYVTCMFDINIRAEYQQQMNDIIQVFIPKHKSAIIIENEGYRYETFVDSDFSITNNLGNLGQEERMFTSKVTFKVLGYLTGDGNNDSQSFTKKTESIVEVKISRERVIVGDEKPWDKTKENYRDL